MYTLVLANAAFLNSYKINYYCSYSVHLFNLFIDDTIAKFDDVLKMGIVAENLKNEIVAENLDK